MAGKVIVLLLVVGMLVGVPVAGAEDRPTIELQDAKTTCGILLEDSDLRANCELIGQAVRWALVPADDAQLDGMVFNMHAIEEKKGRFLEIPLGSTIITNLEGSPTLPEKLEKLTTGRLLVFEFQE